MAFINAVSINTVANFTPALLAPADSFSLVIVRESVFLTASGTDSQAIRAQANNLTLVMDGYAASENAVGIRIISDSELLIGASGVVASGDVAIEGTSSDNEILNNGSIASNSFGIQLAASGHSVTNAGSILVGSGAGIRIADGDSRVANAGTITSGGTGIIVLETGTVSGSTIDNSSTITADLSGILFQGAEVAVTNSGTISAGGDGIRGELIGADGAILTNTGRITSLDNGIRLDGGGATVTNGGSVSADLGAVLFGEGDNILINTGTLASAGTDAGSAAVRSLGSGLKLDNSGEIASAVTGIRALNGAGLTDGTTVGNHDIVNTGTILARSGMAIELYGTGNVVTNNGTLEASGAGIWNTGTASVVNGGTIVAGGFYAILVEDFEGSGLPTSVTNAAEGTILAEAGTGIEVVDEAALLRNRGGITADLSGMVVNGTGGTIGNSGSVTAGENGIVALGVARILNTGEIYAGMSGITVGAAGSGVSRVTNTGTIVAQELAVNLDTVNNGAVLINSGLLAASGGAGPAVAFGTLAGVSGRLINSGTISSADPGGAAVSMGAGADVVRNSGLVDGGVELGSGADLYSARGEGAVEGAVLGGAGNDTLTGADADDVLNGGADDDLLRGGNGDDTLDGENGIDTIRGGAGDDNIDAGAFNDFVNAGRDDDFAVGNDGNDTLNGAAGDDTLIGGAGLDRLLGGKGDDSLNGGNDNDRLDGGQGNDTLIGGTGNDVFVFSPDGGSDLVTDFVDGQDRIDVGAFDFTGFADMLTEATLISVAGGVRIDFDTGASLTLQGVALGALSAADFVF